MLKTGHFTITAFQTVFKAGNSGLFLPYLKDVASTDKHAMTAPVALVNVNCDKILFYLGGCAHGVSPILKGMVKDLILFK